MFIAMHKHAVVKCALKLQIPESLWLWTFVVVVFFLALTIYNVVSVVHFAGWPALFISTLLEALEVCQQGGSAFSNGLFFKYLGDGRGKGKSGRQRGDSCIQ